jgi:drug/metabolite transporter (DMT)-like permease
MSDSIEKMPVLSAAGVGAAACRPADCDARNLTGILAMLASMAAFVINDTGVKLASASLPIGEIITLRNGAATAYLLIFALVFGGLFLPRHPPVTLLGLRMTGEIVSTLLFLTALVHLPLADMTAIAQFTPLALTAGAALFLNEPVGWRRWTATAAGLAGVALIVRPGSAAFSPAGAMVLVSIAFVVLRDLSTRLISAAVPTLTLTVTSAASGIVAGLMLWPFEVWRSPQAGEAGLIALSGLFLAIGYALIIVALRTGDVGLVSPFRYSVILFALASGYVVWGETPDFLAMVGIVIVCCAGLYTVHRERVRRADECRASA